MTKRKTTAMYFLKLYGSIFDNLHKVDKYLEKEKNTKLRQEKWKL